MQDQSLPFDQGTNAPFPNASAPVLINEGPTGFSQELINGQVVLVPQKDLKDADDDRAIRSLPWNLPQNQMDDIFGPGVWLYFKFARFIIFANLLLFAIQMVNFGMHLKEDIFTYSGNVYYFLFTQSYADDIKTAWLGTNITCIALGFLFGPIYYLYVRLYEKQDGVNTHQEDALIEVNQIYSQHERIVRMIGSYIFFCVLIGGEFCAIYYLKKRVNEMDTSANTETFILSLTVTAAISAINLIFKQLCTVLTQVEKHRTWESYKQHHLFKFIVFKLVGIIIIGLAGLSTSEQDECLLKLYGSQYFLLLVVDITVMNVVELLLPKVILLITCKCNDHEVDRRPDFDTSEEYLETIYRQYLVYNALPVFPLSTLFAFLGSILEYYLDKYKLLRVVKKPPVTSDSQKLMIAIYMIVAAAVASVSPLSGNIKFLTVWGCPSKN